MLKEDIEKRIEAKFEGMEESLKYVLDVQCELMSGLQTIRYLLFLSNKTQKK